jgi:hypothetical protein
MINITKIYLVTNIDNDPNKVYIGKTKNLSRKADHKRKFGKQITFDYIDEIDSLEYKDWQPVESYWIEQFKQWGFMIVNNNNGGGGPITHTAESRKKMSYLKPYLYKNILQYNINGILIQEWDNITNAGLSLNKPGCAIAEVCSGKRKSAYGFIWRYKYEPLNKSYTYVKNKSNKSVLQYNKCGSFIEKWDSIKEAAYNIGINAGNISAVCRNKQKSAGGFIWKYKEK